VTEPTKATPQSPRTRRAVQITWVVVICATLYVCYFSHLGVIGFIGPDEPRYAWIARDMMETHDWVTPHLYGKPWFEKPPLSYWAAGLCFRWFGVTEAAARLPSAISALLATLGMAWLALRLYGAETARWVLLLLPTTVGIIGFSHAASTDMPFSAMLTIAMVCASPILGLTRNKSTPMPRWGHLLALVLFGAFLGLAVLAKGPAAILLSGGAVFFWALFTKRKGGALRLLHPVAIASFCATALPWYVLCARRNSGFLRVFIIEHNFKRYLTPEFQHIQPFWFYVPVLLVALLPWTALFLWSTFHGAIRLLRTRRAQESTLLLACWAGFCVVFFSISRSKLPGYILPALPALVLILAHTLTSVAKIPRSLLRVALWLFSLLLFFPLAFVELLTPGFSRANPRFVIGACVIVALVGAANFLLAFFAGPAVEKRPLPFLAATCVLPMLVAAMLGYFIAPSFFKFDPSGKTLARELQRHNIPLSELAVGWMSRGQHYSMNFYLHEEIQDWNLENSRREYVLTDMPHCRNLTPVPFACEPVPFDEQVTGVFLYHVVMPGSVLELGNSGGQAQKKE
jgi:4-amino-4-deoxy-L-arabinose transferase-like glycosyltransferase